MPLDGAFFYSQRFWLAPDVAQNVGICMSGMCDGKALHANHSGGYALRSKAVSVSSGSNTSAAHLSGIFVQYPG